MLEALARHPDAGRGRLAAPEPDVVFLSMAPIEVSSSLVRERIEAGQMPTGLLVGAVARYIAEHGLYGVRG